MLLCAVAAGWSSRCASGCAAGQNTLDKRLQAGSAACFGGSVLHGGRERFFGVFVSSDETCHIGNHGRTRPDAKTEPFGSWVGK